MKVAVCLVAGSFLFSSCFVGSWGLFNKYADWQTHMTSNKFVNAVVGLVLGAICYPISTLVDALVLNTIEFWSGSNPVQANVGKTQQVMGQDGRYYAVTTLKNGYEVKAPTGEITYFYHNANETPGRWNRMVSPRNSSNSMLTVRPSVPLSTTRPRTSP